MKYLLALPLRMELDVCHLVMRTVLVWENAKQKAVKGLGMHLIGTHWQVFIGGCQICRRFLVTKEKFDWEITRWMSLDVSVPQTLPVNQESFFGDIFEGLQTLLAIIQNKDGYVKDCFSFLDSRQKRSCRSGRKLQLEVSYIKTNCQSSDKDHINDREVEENQFPFEPNWESLFENLTWYTVVELRLDWLFFKQIAILNIKISAKLCCTRFNR